MKRLRKQKLIAAGVVVAFGGLIYLKNRLAPKYADDYPYSFIWEGEEHGNLAFGNQHYERVRNVKDLVKSQISHYKTWDGRVVAESLVQAFLIPDKKDYFDVANTAVILSQIAICSGLGKSKAAKKLSAPLKAMVLTGGFWSCAPHLIASCFWLTGSMNYLWVGTLQSAYVLQYSRKFHDASYRIPTPLAAFMGLMAGWSTETGAGAAFLLSLLELFYSKLRKETEPWMVAGVFGCFAGMLLLLLAPGNRVKFKIEEEFSDTLPKDLNDRLPGYVPEEYLYTPYMFKAYFKEGFLPTVIRELPLQLPVLAYILDKKCHTKEASLYIAAMEAAALAVPTVMMLSPEYPIRSTYPSVLYLLGASVYALEQTGTDTFPYNSKWFKWVKAAVGCSLAVNVAASLIADADFYGQMEDQVQKLKEDRDGEITIGCVFPPPIYSFLAGDRSIDQYNCMGLGGESYDPYNKATAAYYGFKDYTVDYEIDHPYEEKGLHAIIYQLTQPLKYFVRRMKELFAFNNRK